MGIFVITGFKGETLYILFVDLVILVLSLSPSSSSGLDQRSNCLIWVQERLLVGAIKVLIGEGLKLYSILHFANLSQLNRLVELSFDACDFFEFILLLPDLIVLSNAFKVITFIGFTTRVHWHRSWGCLKGVESLGARSSGFSVKSVLLIAEGAHQISRVFLNFLFWGAHPSRMVSWWNYSKNFIGVINPIILLIKHLSFKVWICWIKKVPFLVLHMSHNFFLFGIKTE